MGGGGWVKTCALNTVSKSPVKEPTKEWKMKLLQSEHSPIRELWFDLKMEILYFVSTHFVTHHIGVNHYVSTQRSDRTGIYRDTLPQGAIVSHIMSINAQELMFMSCKRLCHQASTETREVIQEIVDLIVEKCPEFNQVFMPQCEYLGGRCLEFKPCRYNKTFKNNANENELGR